MYSKIKEMAEEALRLQNKNFMDETFKRIIAVCDEAPTPFNPEKIVLEDLMCGNVALIDGEYVKITRVDAALAVTDTAIHVDTAPAEFPFAAAASISEIDTALSEIPPGPQVVLKRAKKWSILDLDSACQNLANTAIKHADEQSQAAKKEGVK